jgi:hypothetical protein
VLTWAYALGFGGSTIPVGVYLHHHGRLPSFLGLFDAYAGPWWERFGPRAFLRLLMAFLVVTLVAATVAALIWDGSALGVVLTVIVMPWEAMFWFGFDLPIPKMLGLVRLALIVAGSLGR